MCSNASITKILGISDNNLVILGNEKENIKGFVEKTAVEGAQKNDKFQFIRNGFYCVDSKYSSDDKLVFNRIVPLKSSFKL